MFNKTKTVLSVAMILGALGAASAAWAGSKDDADGSGGGYVVGGNTTGVNPAYHREVFGTGGTSYGYAVWPGQRHRPSHDRR